MAGLSDERFEAGKKEIWNGYLGKTALTAAIWAGLMLYIYFESDNVNSTRAVMLQIGAYSSFAWAPLLMFWEWRKYKRDMRELEDKREA